MSRIRAALAYLSTFFTVEKFKLGLNIFADYNKIVLFIIHLGDIPLITLIKKLS